MAENNDIPQEWIDRAANQPSEVSREEADRWGWSSTNTQEQGKIDEANNPSGGSSGGSSNP